MLMGHPVYKYRVIFLVFKAISIKFFLLFVKYIRQNPNCHLKLGTKYNLFYQFWIRSDLHINTITVFLYVCKYLSTSHLLIRPKTTET